MKFYKRDREEMRVKPTVIFIFGCQVAKVVVQWRGSKSICGMKVENENSLKRQENQEYLS
jgi:hypothetical protein